MHAYINVLCVSVAMFGALGDCICKIFDSFLHVMFSVCILYAINLSCAAPSKCEHTCSGIIHCLQPFFLRNKKKTKNAIAQSHIREKVETAYSLSA